MRGKVTIILVMALGVLPVPGSGQDDGLIFPAVERELEDWRHALLARTQAQPGNRLQTFTTDGCSGGLSDSWRFLASRLPGFAETFGNKPPYEACCIEHDRTYWQGAAEQGFDRRLAADLALKACVTTYGKDHSREFAERFGLSEAVIEQNFAITAALMFRAVRVGGVPCSGLPWRWGYGWPECKDTEHAN